MDKPGCVLALKNTSRSRVQGTVSPAVLARTVTPNRTKGLQDVLLVIAADLQRVRDVKLVEFWVE